MRTTKAVKTARDRRLTPKGTSLALGSQSSIDKMFDDWLSDATLPDSVGKVLLTKR